MQSPVLQSATPARLTAAAVDLGYVERALIEREGHTAESAAECVRQYRVMLALRAALPDQPLVPTVAADAAWHHHMLHSRRYMADSGALFGQYLHHEPEASAEELEAGWRLTSAHIGTADAAHCLMPPLRTGGTAAAHCLMPPLADAAHCLMPPLRTGDPEAAHCLMPPLNSADTEAGTATPSHCLLPRLANVVAGNA